MLACSIWHLLTTPYHLHESDVEDLRTEKDLQRIEELREKDVEVRKALTQNNHINSLTTQRLENEKQTLRGEIISRDAQIKDLTAKLEEARKAQPPDLKVEIGNGPPYDDENYRRPEPPAPSADPAVRLAEVTAILQALNEPASPAQTQRVLPSSSVRPIGHGKKVKVTNVGQTVAYNCRASLTKPHPSVYTIYWESENGEQEVRDLAPGEYDFLVLYPDLFPPYSMTYDFEIRVFAKDLPAPVILTTKRIVVESQFPFVVTLPESDAASTV